MPTKQLVYEGSNLESLIRRVIDEHGPARIRPPERRRKGGLFGFFAKEVYVVSVDEAAPKPLQPSVPPAGLPADTLNPFAALVESTHDELQLSSSGGRAAVGTKQDFSDVLRQVASSLGEEPGTYRPPSRAPVRPSASTPRAPHPAQATPAQATPAQATPASVTAAPLVPIPVMPASVRGAGPVTPARVTPASVAPVPVRSTAVEEPAQLLPPTDVRPVPMRGADAALVDLLTAAGCPRSLVSRARGPLSTTLEAFFAEQLPVAPLPTMAGALLAVVGDARAVRSVAQAAAGDAGVAAGEISVVSPVAGDRHAPPGFRARTAEEVAALAPGWRRDRVGVVAVHAPPLGGDQHWTRHVLSSMRPSCVWGVVDATTKLDDIKRWIAAIGGVDALALREPGATSSPAAILGLGIPVARLGASAATPRLWASLVTALATRG